MSRYFQSDQITDMMTRYESGQSICSIGKDYHVCASTVSRILRRNNVELRGIVEANRKLKVNDNSFSAITDESAYWIGFLMADGCVFGHEVRLSLKSIDEDHVKKFRSFLGSEHKIGHVTNYCGTHVSVLAVKSHQLVDDLFKYGVTPRKSHTATAAPQLLNNVHFWRGLIDGDGWVGYINNIPHLGLVGSRFLVKQFIDFIECATGKRGTMHKHSHADAYYTHYRGTTAKSILEILYPYDATVYLDRKYQKAVVGMSYVDRRYKNGH